MQTGRMGAEDPSASPEASPSEQLPDQSDTVTATLDLVDDRTSHYRRVRVTAKRAQVFLA